MTGLAILSAALATYLVRAFAFKVALPSALPRGIVRYLDALPAAVIAALAGPAVLVPDGRPTHGPELIAAIVVIAVVARSRNLLAGALAGVAAVALLRLI